MFLLQKKAAWSLLNLFFIFDNVVSYFAVKYWGGREANLLIAPVVEKYPLLYFLLTPVEILIIYLIFWVSKKFAEKLLRKWNFNENILERLILQVIVIYWAIGNSSPNLIFLLGFRLPGLWSKTSVLAAITIIFYFVLLLKYKKGINQETK